MDSMKVISEMAKPENFTGVGGPEKLKKLTIEALRSLGDAVTADDNLRHDTVGQAIIMYQMSQLAKLLLKLSVPRSKNKKEKQ